MKKCQSGSSQTGNYARPLKSIDLFICLQSRCRRRCSFLTICHLIFRSEMLHPAFPCHDFHFVLHSIFIAHNFLKLIEECFPLALGGRRGGPPLRCYHKPIQRSRNCPFFSSLPKYKVMLTVVSDDKVFAAMKTFSSEIFTQPLGQNIPSQNCPRSTQEPNPLLFSKNIENNLCHVIVAE